MTEVNEELGAYNSYKQHESVWKEQGNFAFRGVEKEI